MSDWDVNAKTSKSTPETKNRRFAAVKASSTLSFILYDDISTKQRR